jgi:hypothetical protein
MTFAALLALQKGWIAEIVPLFGISGMPLADISLQNQQKRDGVTGAAWRA